MRSVLVTTQVPYPREKVYDFLDVMSNHEPFTNHMLRDWEYSGPDRGIGSRAKVKVSAAGRTDTIEIEVVAAERPARIVERNVGAGGRRVATGTYTTSAKPCRVRPAASRWCLGENWAERGIAGLVARGEDGPDRRSFGPASYPLALLLSCWRR